MIVIDLECAHEHLFEGWFASIDAYQTQHSKGLVACPVCGNNQLVRRPSAPYLKTGATCVPETALASRVEETQPQPASAEGPRKQEDAAAMMTALLRIAARHSEDVGERFPEEARRMHHGETESRSIRGQASGEEVRELLEEGILVMPVPTDESDLH